MSMEEFIRNIETNPNPSAGAGGGSSGADALITHKRIRRSKHPKTGETIETEEYDIDSKTVLTAPTSFTVAETFLDYLNDTFGELNNLPLRGFIRKFKINMPNKDGLAREQYTRVLEGRHEQAAEETKSLLERLAHL